MTVRQECPARNPHNPHTHLDGAAVCPGVLAPPIDTSWLHERAAHVPASADPFHGLRTSEVWLILLAQLAGMSIVLLCARMPAPWGMTAFLLTIAALTAALASILLRLRRR